MKTHRMWLSLLGWTLILGLVAPPVAVASCRTAVVGMTGICLIVRFMRVPGQ